MLEYTFRPLSQWPQEATPSHRRKRAPFRAGYVSTLDLLERELIHLRAKDVVFEADCPSSEIRNDGRLRSSAKLRGPGIVVSFDSPKGPLRFPCDRFIDWEDNLRAIALTLEHLRACDRYGVTSHNEQYKGWTGLPDKREQQPDRNLLAAPVICRQAAYYLPESIDVAFVLAPSERRGQIIRRLKMALHPDHRNGSDEEFKQLMRALELLGL